MPRYEYKCNKCQTQFEYLIIRSDDKPQCPTCSETNKKALEKVFNASNSSFSLKGKGWYKDGY